MAETRVSPLRQRMIEDMTRDAHIDFLNERFGRHGGDHARLPAKAGAVAPPMLPAAPTTRTRLFERSSAVVYPSCPSSGRRNGGAPGATSGF
jgi:hypothetical protein